MRVSGSGCRFGKGDLAGLGFRVWSSKVWDSGVEAVGLGVGDQGVRVWGFGV